jgi:hypothetical protein
MGVLLLRLSGRARIPAHVVSDRLVPLPVAAPCAATVRLVWALCTAAISRPSPEHGQDHQLI